MSETPAAIRAVFAEWRMVKTRKVLALVFEVPLETQGDVLTVLGAPMPDAEIWCGIARLQPVAAEPEKPKDEAKSRRAKELYDGLTPEEQAVARAGRLAKDEKFQTWIAETALDLPVGAIASEAYAAQFIRDCCGVESRREFATNSTARSLFSTTETEYLAATGQLSEIH